MFRRAVTHAAVTAIALLLAPVAYAAPPVSVGATTLTSSAGGGNSATIAVSPDGSSIVAGQFAGQLRLGALTLDSAAGAFADIFVAKRSVEGTWLWATRASGSGGTDDAYEVVALPDGSALVTGYFRGTMTLGALPPLVAGGSTDPFVAKIGADGTWLWATSATGAGSSPRYAESFAVSAFADGSAVLAGYYVGDLDFASAGTLSRFGASNASIFVARISADGTWVWATRAGNASGLNQAVGVAALADGVARVTGYFQGTVAFGTSSVTAVGSWDLFVAEIGADGSWGWVTRAGGAGSVMSTSSITAFSDGSALVGGSFDGTVAFGTSSLATSATSEDAFVARITADGSWVWASMVGVTREAKAYTAAARPDGSAVVSGWYRGAAQFGDHPLPDSGAYESFVARIAADGTWQWATGSQTTAGTGAYSLGVGIVSDGSVASAGVLDGGTVVFGSTAFTAVPSGNENTFVWDLLDVPFAPEELTATAGDASATATWAALGPAVTSYVVTASPGGASCTAAAPTTRCVVTGLTNDTTYAFTVRAVNAAGTGPASSASAAVTPRSTPTPTPESAFAIRSIKRTSAYTFTARVRLSGPGVVTQSATRVRPGVRSRAWVCSARAVATAARTVTLRCRANAAARRIIRTRPLRLQVRVIFTPTGGTAARKTRTVVMPRFAPKPRPVTG